MLFNSQRMIAVEMAGDEIRAAVVRKKGRSFEVVDYSAVKKADPQDDLPDVEALKALCERLDIATGPAVLVTPMARAFEMYMNRNKIAKMKHYQLLETAKWEVEPYTGISGSNALIGAEQERRPERDPGEIVDEDEDEQISVTITAIERNVYRAIRARLKAAGLTLVRIYPPELTFYYVLFLHNVKNPRALLEVGRDYSSFALVKGDLPEQAETLNLSLDALQDHINGDESSFDLVDALRMTVGQAPDPEPLLVTGPGAGFPPIVEFISQYSPTGALALDIPRTAGVSESRRDGAGVMYGTAVGAAVRELKGRIDRQAGISDRMPLIPRLKKNANVVPLAVTIGLLLILSGHYQYMKYKDRVYKARIETLKNELKSRKADIAKYKKLVAESDKIKKDIVLAGKRLKYVEGQSDENLEHIISCISGLAEALSDEIMLVSISQMNSNNYLVIGAAFDLKALGSYTTRLQESPWCSSAVLNKLEKGKGPNRLDFELLLNARRNPV